MEGVKEEVVLSPAHALSLIAAGEGKYTGFIVLKSKRFFDLVIY